MDQAIRRPVPRWLHIWAIVSVVTTALLLIVGGFVTTFRVGMADPVWPTEPWYLASNYKLDFGYLVEHVHRILGWIVGLLGLVLTFGAWAVEPRRGLRWFGIVSIVAVIASFVVLLIAFIKATKGEEGTAVVAASCLTVATIVIALWAAGRAFRTKSVGGTIRALTVLGLIGGLIQGVLGGVRVRYNDLFGREMSAVHGSVAQIVFGLLIAVAILSARVRPEPFLSADIARKLRWQTLCLLLFTYAQIVWGAWIRHFPEPLSNRLHLLFAFVVVGFATLTIKQALVDSVSRQRFKVATRFMMGLITIQVLLGIEAWLGKFLTGTLPELETITAGKAFIRTAHAHIGAWVLGMAVIFYIIARRNPVEVDGHTPAASLDLEDAAALAATAVRSP
jgi:heme A synthase